MTKQMLALFNRRNFPIILFYIGWWWLDHQNPVVYFLVYILIVHCITKILIGGEQLNYISSFIISIVIFVLSLKV